MIGILKETPAAIQIREVLSYNNKKQRVEHFLKDGKTISMKLPFQRIKRRIKRFTLIIILLSLMISFAVNIAKYVLQSKYQSWIELLIVRQCYLLLPLLFLTARWIMHILFSMGNAILLSIFHYLQFLSSDSKLLNLNGDEGTFDDDEDEFDSANGDNDDSLPRLNRDTTSRPVPISFQLPFLLTFKYFFNLLFLLNNTIVSGLYHHGRLSLLQLLASITTICVIDKQGILSDNVNYIEKICFFNSDQLTVLELSRNQKDNYKRELMEDYEDAEEELESAFHDLQNLDEENQLSKPKKHVNFSNLDSMRSESHSEKKEETEEALEGGEDLEETQNKREGEGERAKSKKTRKKKSKKRKAEQKGREEWEGDLKGEEEEEGAMKKRKKRRKKELEEEEGESEGKESEEEEEEKEIEERSNRGGLRLVQGGDQSGDTEEMEVISEEKQEEGKDIEPNSDSDSDEEEEEQGEGVSNEDKIETLLGERKRKRRENLQASAPSFRYEIQFNDFEWEKYLPSLKPLGFNCLANSFCQFGKYNENVERESSGVPYANSKMEIINYSCNCLLGIRIGFTEDALDHFQPLQHIYRVKDDCTDLYQLLRQRHLELTKRNESSLEDESEMDLKARASSYGFRYFPRKIKNKITDKRGYSLSTVVEETINHSLQLSNKGTPALILKNCASAWDGGSLHTISLDDIQSIIDLENQWLGYHCIAFSFSPISEHYHHLFFPLEEDSNSHPLSTSSFDEKFHFYEQMMENEQIFIGMIAMRQLPRYEIENFIIKMKAAGTHFVYFSTEDRFATNAFSERMGLETV